MAGEPQVTLQVLRVMEALLDRADDGHYGYDLIRRTGLKSGTLYPILARLEAAGLVSSDWETNDPAGLGRPRRRFYRLTVDGVGQAKDQLAIAPGSGLLLPERASG